MCYRAHCHKLQTKKANLLYFRFLLLKVTTKQSTKAFRNINLNTKKCRRMEGWAWWRRRMAGHFQNSTGDGGIMGYLVFSFNVNHLISLFLLQIGKIVFTGNYSLRLTFFVLFEKLNFLRKHHLLSCLPFKNI